MKRLTKRVKCENKDFKAIIKDFKITKYQQEFLPFILSQFEDVEYKNKKLYLTVKAEVGKIRIFIKPKSAYPVMYAATLDYRKYHGYFYISDYPENRPYGYQCLGSFAHEFSLAKRKKNFFGWLVMIKKYYLSSNPGKATNKKAYKFFRRNNKYVKALKKENGMLIIPQR